MKKDSRWKDKYFKESCILVDMGKIPRYLYKYTQINENSLSNIENNQLWFSNPKYFNDPFDFQFDLENKMSDDDVSQLIDSYIKKGLISKQLRNEMILLLKSKPNEISKIVNKNIQKVLLTVGISCFSEHKDNILMWSHYANNHKGVCLKFDVLKDTSFFFAGDESKSTVAIRKVIYSPKNYSHLNANGIIKQKLILQVVPFTKYKDWKYEKEVRIVSKKTGIIHYSRDALIEINFGCKIYYSDIQRVKRSTHLCGYKDIVFFKAEKSSTEFSLDFKRIV